MNNAQRLIKLVESLDSGLDQWHNKATRETIKGMKIESMLKEYLPIEVSVNSNVDGNYNIHVGTNNYPNDSFEGEYELPFDCMKKDVMELIDEIMNDIEDEGYGSLYAGVYDDDE